MNHEWILTDDSSNQHMRALSDGDGRVIRFEGIDIMTIPFGDCMVVRGEVVIDRFQLDDAEFIAQYLKPYCYESFESLKRTYGGEDCALQVVAEIMFETDARGSDAVFNGSFDECYAFITRLCEEDA